MKKSMAWLMCAALLLAFFLPGCEEAEEEDLSAQDWINKGLGYLGKGDGTSAYLAFSEALKIEKGNLNARYGQVLANVLQLKETVKVFTDLLAGEEAVISAQTAGDLCGSLNRCGLLDSLGMDFEQCINWAAGSLPEGFVPCMVQAGTHCAQAATCLDTLAGAETQLCRQACDSFDECGFLEPLSVTVADCVESCPVLYTTESLECYLASHPCDIGVENCFDHLGAGLQKLLDDLLADISAEMLGNLEQIFKHPDWNFLIPKYNFTLLDLLFQPSLTGENDLADAHFMNGIANGIAGIINLLFALDLDFNPNLLEDLSLDLSAFETADPSQAGTDTVIELLRQIQGLFDRILKDPVYSSFLTLNEEDGIVRMQQASVNIGMTFGEMVRMVDAIAMETDEQWDDAIRYLDTNNNQLWEDDELLLIPGVGLFDKELISAIRDLFLALKINFVDGVPFALNSLNGLLSYADLEWMTLVLDLLYVLDMGEIDLAASLRTPDPDGLRPLVEDLSALLDLIIVALEQIER